MTNNHSCLFSNDAFSVSSKNIPRINLVLHIVETGVVSVRDDGVALALELIQVVDYTAAEECAAVLYGRLIDDDLHALGLDPLHHALDAALAEVVAVRLHRQAVHTDHALPRLVRAEVPVVVLAVEPGHVKDPVRDEVLARAVAVHYRLDQVLRNVRIIRKELLRVLRKAVASVTETRVVVEVPDPRVEAHALDYRIGIQAFHLRVGVELVEVAHTQGEVRVGEELHSLSLGQPHVKGLDVLLQRAFLQQGGELVRSTVQTVITLRAPHYDAARVEVVVQGLALPQELRREDDVPGPCLAAYALGVSHRYRALYDHDSLGVDLHDQVYDLLHVARVEVVPHRVVVGRGRDDHEVGIPVGGLPVEGGHQVQVLLRKVFLYIFILDWGLPPVYELHFLRDNIHRGDMVVLPQQRRDAQAHVAGAGDGDLDIFFALHCLKPVSPMGAIKDPGVIVIVCLYPVVQFLCRILPSPGGLWNRRGCAS